MKLLMLDVDGTMTGTLSGHTFKQHPHDIRVLDGVCTGLEHYAQDKWQIVGITNQGGIGYGYKSLEDAIEEMQHTLLMLPQLSAIYLCPDFNGELCYKVSRMSGELQYQTEEYSRRRGTYSSFRKPGAGMLQLAIEEWAGTALHRHLLYVGDRPEDEQAAEAASLNFYFAEAWRSLFMAKS